MVVYILQIYYCTNFSLAANRPCSKQSHLKVDPGESEYDNIHLIITKCCSWKKQDPTTHQKFGKYSGCFATAQGWASRGHLG
mmetsp:Transcript_36897/g.54018  ORF Transcript_36897/g.54018 Transcript_36897/m.54018 type:complete len:82 (-) Transcript_36897:251-496(-)